MSSINNTAAALVLLTALPALAQNPGLVQGTAEVQSDRLEVDHNLKKAHFEGNVKAAWGNLKLRCDKMEISYNDRGEVVSLRAVGSVAVARDDSRATAGSARLDARQNILILEGNPVLVQGPHRLKGSRVVVHLSSGRLEVTEATGTFHLGKRKTN
ncbi:MAG: hypothetical protein GY854_02835 [Deltaproteobacteria bacterium]|nr:hypothetical protein [Deltaproteobacteria bacterium]